MDQTYMKTKKILPLVMSMAVPMVLSMLINSLYNIVDSLFIAKISEDAMTAISLVFPLYNFAGAVSIGFGVGANAVTAYFLGEGNQKNADGAASLSLLLSLVHSAILTVGLLIAVVPFLKSFTDSRPIIDYGSQYGFIVFGGLLIGQISLIYEKLFQAIGRVRISMFSMIAGCVTNIVLDPVMIFGIGPCPAMGIRGAAIGQTDIPVAWRNMFLFFRESCRCFLESVRWLCGKGRQSASGRISPIHIRICLTVSAGFIIPYFIRRSHFADARRAGQSVVS